MRAYILETPNAFQPYQDLQKHEVTETVTIRQWLNQTYPDREEFPVPTICIFNGQYLLRDQWNRELQDGDVVNFVSVVNGIVEAIVLAVIIVAVSVALMLLMPMPTTPGKTPESDPVFSLKGKQNEIRLGEPIEVSYGRNRIYPSLASRPYFLYKDNDQFQYALYCIGQGRYQIDAVQVGDTPIANYKEASYEIVPPGSIVTLFQTNIYTSNEAGGQKLSGTNETDYVAPGYVGPFVVNPAGSTVTHIDIDLAYPKGIYLLASNGTLAALTVSTQAQYRQIDNAGSPVGAGTWSNLFLNDNTLATVTPQRITIGTDVPAARYEVRVRRTNTAGTTTNVGDEVQWDGMRGYLAGSNPNFGDVTVLAVRIQASNNLNNNSRQLVNVIATRKLPLRDSSSGAWTTYAASRSIVWAFVDIFRSSYGGRLADIFFDWDALEALDSLFESRNEHFDWTFRDSITVWEAAAAVAQVGRAVPMLVGSLVSMRRNGPLTVPVTLFGPDNIVKGSFEHNMTLWEQDEFDCIDLEYTEVSRGYEQLEVRAVLPGDTSDHPESVRLSGCQDRTHAYRYALFLLAMRRYVRETFTFETGMEGLIASYGDLIAVCHDVPNWGTSGYIVNAETASSGLITLLLSQQITYGESGPHSILLRGRQGQVLGPYEVIPYDSNHTSTMVIIDPLGDSAGENLDFLLGGLTEPMIFIFGVVGSVTQYARIVGIEPQGGERVKIVAAPNEPIIHSFDALTPPPLPVTVTIPEIPSVPDLGNVLTLNLEPNSDKVNIIGNWKAVPTAYYYAVISFRSDTPLSLPLTFGKFVSQDFPYINQFTKTVSTPGYWAFRVYPVTAAGYSSDYIENFILVGKVYGLEVSGDWELDLTIAWWHMGGNVAYHLRIYDNSGSAPVLKHDEVLTGVFNRQVTYLYTYATMVSEGNVNRNLLITVDTMHKPAGYVFLIDDGWPATLEANNPYPAAPDLSGKGYDSEDQPSPGDVISFRYYWSNPHVADLIRVDVWISATSGFDPLVTAPLYSYTAGSPGYGGVPEDVVLDIALVSGVFADHYWRVAVYDVWGNEIVSNLSDEDVITVPWLDAAGTWDDLGRWQDSSNWID